MTGQKSSRSFYMNENSEIGLNGDTSVSDQGITGSSQDSTNPARVLTQDEVNKLISTSKLAAYEKGKRDALNSNNQQSSQQQSQRAASSDNVEKLVEEKVRKIQEEAQGAHVANQLANRILASKERYPQAIEQIKQMELTENPRVLMLLNNVNEPAAIINELHKNPAKLANVIVLADTKPKLALQELAKLSDSIKENEKAEELAKKAGDTKQAEVLNRVKGSNNHVDNGRLSIAEKQKLKLYRV